MVEKTNLEMLEEAEQKAMEQMAQEEPEKTFFAKAIDKGIEIKDAIVAEYNRDPRYYKGAAMALCGSLIGVCVAHRVIKNGMANHGYTDMFKVGDDSYTIRYGYLGLFGRKHKFLDVTGSKEQMVTYAKSILRNLESSGATKVSYF